MDIQLSHFFTSANISNLHIFKLYCQERQGAFCILTLVPFLFQVLLGNGGSCTGDIPLGATPPYTSSTSSILCTCVTGETLTPDKTSDNNGRAAQERPGPFPALEDERNAGFMDKKTAFLLEIVVREMPWCLNNMAKCVEESASSQCGISPYGVSNLQFYFSHWDSSRIATVDSSEITSITLIYLFI